MFGLNPPSPCSCTKVLKHWDLLKRQVLTGQVKGPMVHDARIATICVSHGVTELWTADRDFSRFPNVPTRNPLLG